MVDSATDTPPPVPTQADLSAFSSKDRDTWLLTGEVPTPNVSAVEPDAPARKSDGPPDSSPAELAAQATSTDVPPSPASEPGTPKKANAETRKAELAAEIQALLKQRDEVKASLAAAPRSTAPPDVQADSSPAAPPVSLDSLIDAPDVTQPFLKEEAFYAQFPEATVADYVRYAASYQAERVAFRQAAGQRLRSREAYFAERAAQASEVAPDALTKLPPDVVNAMPVDLLPAGTTPGLWNYAVQEILNAAEPGRLLAHLADHPEVVQQIAQTTSPRETIRTIAQIEARLGTSVIPSPAVKTATSAPPPPVTLGSKPSIPSDEIDEALATGDFRKYRAAMNRQEMGTR